MSSTDSIEPGTVQDILLAVLSSPTPQSSPDEIKAFIANVVKPLLPAGFFDAIVIDSAGNLLARRPGKPGTKPLVLYTYAAFQTWKQAVEKAKSTEMEAVTKAMNDTEFDTVVGKFKFNEKGDPNLPPYAVYRWSKGTYDQITE